MPETPGARLLRAVRSVDRSPTPASRPHSWVWAAGLLGLVLGGSGLLLAFQQAARTPSSPQIAQDAPGGPLATSCGRWVPAAPLPPAFPWHWATAQSDWVTAGPLPAPPAAPAWTGGAVSLPDNIWYTHPLLRHQVAGVWQDVVLPNLTGRIETVTVLPNGQVWALGSSWGQGPPGGPVPRGGSFVVRGQPGAWTVTALDPTNTLALAWWGTDEIWLAGGVWTDAEESLGDVERAALRHWDGQHWEQTPLSDDSAELPPARRAGSHMTAVVPRADGWWAVGWQRGDDLSAAQPLVVRYAAAGCGSRTPDR